MPPLIFGLFLTLTALAADPRLAGLESKIDSFVATYQGTPNTGVAVGVILDGELVFSKGYGYRDREKKLPVTERTVFAIGSATKSFVATGLAMAREQGLLDFTAPVRSYLPDFALDSAAATASANLQDLLSHQTGLPRHDFLWYLTPFTSAQLFKKLEYLEMDSRPGMGFRSGVMQYNNLMFMTAGRVLASRTGSKWEDFVSARILAPLGMSETTFDLGGFRSPDSARGYAREKLLPYKDLGGVTAAGSINSNVADLAKWVALHLNKGVSPAGTRLLDQASLKDLYQKHSDASASGIELGYGLGMMLSPVRGHTVVWHGGNIDGFSAHVSFLPEKGIGLVVLTNQDSAGNFEYPFLVKAGDREVALLPYLIYDHLLGSTAPITRMIDPRRISAITASLDVPGFEKAPAPKPLVLVTDSPAAFPAELAGTFYERAYGDISVTAGALSEVTYYGHRFTPVGTEDSDTFRLLNENGAQTNLTLAIERENGVISGFTVPFEAAVRPIRFTRAKIR